MMRSQGPNQGQQGQGQGQGQNIMGMGPNQGQGQGQGGGQGQGQGQNMPQGGQDSRNIQGGRYGILEPYLELYVHTFRWNICLLLYILILYFTD